MQVPFYCLISFLTSLGMSRATWTYPEGTRIEASTF
jgi:hypothetical protein